MAQIKTYARLKPSKRAYPGYELNKNVLTVHIPDNKDFLILGPQQAIRSNVSYDIIFTDIFRPEATQEEVFDGVAKDIIQNFLNGYNGTIFAYGQTGTGKTYTVEGNTTRYSTRGLATRALSMIYQQLENRTDEHISVYLSYLEIYQEVAYDLLNPAARSSFPVAPFAKVTVVEGPRGSCILRGLSLHLAANEEIAQMLLLQGQANRKVAETPVNQRSSRSHAVFTVYLQVRKHDSEVLVNSKLHLVDLAGSERVSKTGVDGQQLTEAKSINLSLHHLETVIIALQNDRVGSASSSGGGDKSRGEVLPLQSRSNTSFMSGPSSDNGTRPYRFVPYRNSLLTMVLKDSLGGNCLTAMIATISMEPENLGESISTCRFAQRVARIANNAKRNEEVDDKTLIKRLKHKVAYLENQVALLRSKGSKNDPITDEEILDVLTEEDRIACARIMEGFLQGVITDPVDAGICDQCRFRECLHLLKHQYLHSQSLSDAQSLMGTATTSSQQQRRGEAEPPPELRDHMRPNNPQRDSGDHVMSTTNQGTSPITLSMQRPPQISTSGITVHPSSICFNLSDAEELGDSERTGGGEVTPKPEKKSSELDQLLDSCARDKYPSPYERKRVKEIKKLSRKLNSIEQDQAMKQEQLEQMKQDTMMQEILSSENSLRLKLQVAGEQVADQHAYLLQLKHIQADPELIAREHLVEKHLLKRQAKFQEKLNQLLESKDQLQQELSAKAEQSLTVVGTSGTNKKSLEEKFGQFKQGKGSMNTRQVYEMLKNEEKKQQKESVKVDREKTMVQTKQLAIKEAATLEKLRELKQMLRMSQQHGENVGFGLMPSEQFHRTPEGYPVNNSHSGESGMSLKEDNSFNRFSCDVKVSPEMDKKLHQDQTWTHSPAPSNRNSSWAREPSLHVDAGAHGAEEQAKRMDNYLKKVLGQSGYMDKVAPEARQNKHDDQRKSGEGNHILENGGSYIASHNSLPYQLDGQGNTTANAAHVRNHTSVDSPTNEGLHPVETRSFHDPRHSHKFAFDDRPFESNSVNTPQKNGVESLYATTMSTNNNRDPYNFNTDTDIEDNSNIQDYNTNASSNHLEDLEVIDMFQQDPAILESHKSPPRSLRHGLPRDVQDRHGDLKISDLDFQAVQDADHIPTRDIDGRRLLKSTNHKGVTSDATEHSVPSQSDTIAHSSSQRHEQISDFLSPSTDLSSSTTPYSLRAYRLGENSPHVLMPSEYINSMTSHDKFDARKMGLSSRTFESALSHMLSADESANVPNLPYGVDPYEKYSRIPKDSKSQNRYRTQRKSPTRNQSKSPTRNQSKSPTGNSTGEKRKEKPKDGAVEASPDLAPAVDARTAWGPNIKNSSIADRLSGLLETASDSPPKAENSSGFGAEHRKNKKTSLGNSQMDPFQTKLAEYKRMEKMDDDGVEEDYSEEDSFFGLQPAKTKLTALKPDEGEKTYMSAVAAEKARVAKIRRARQAAEVIQRRWRAFRARQ